MNILNRLTSHGKEIPPLTEENQQYWINVYLKLMRYEDKDAPTIIEAETCNNSKETCNKSGEDAVNANNEGGTE